jgi:hypothetical protein
MNTILLSALSAAALLPAAPPAAPVPAYPAEALPLTGKVLVLKNERTVEGDIEYVAGRYRVRRPVGETWIEAAGVLRLCGSHAEAYGCLRAQALLKPEDVDRRLRLAEWCLDHGLKAEARAETEEVLRLNKTHPESRRLLARLQTLQTPGVTQPVAPPPALPAPPPAPDLELTSEALNLFGTRVQPILMNACASCHNDTQNTAFRLLPTSEIGVGNRTTLRRNVAAVLAYVSPTQPLASPFLIKAASVHWWRRTPDGPHLAAGDPSQPPFQNRHAPAYRTLEDWVRLAVSTSPQFVDVQPVSLPPAPPTTPGARSVPVEPVRLDAPGVETPLPRKVETLPPVPPALLTPPPPVPAALRPASSGPDSPPGACDADEFNRRHHPDRTKPAEAPKP